LIKRSLNDDEKLKEFCRHWSLKESYVKATGTGINVNLEDLSFLTYKKLSASVVNDTILLKKGNLLSDWTFEESVLDDNKHCVAVARNFNCDQGSFDFLDIADLLSSDFDLLTPPDHDYTAKFMSKDKIP
jgi:4'-phosphopantetheinyl transferase superfamily